MAKWVRHIFRGSRSDGSHFVMSGPAYQGLALVRVGKGMYSLTHMKTGARVISVDGDYSDVRKFAEAIADLTNWESLETTEAVVAEPGLADRIAHLASFYSDEDVSEAGNA